ncbi:L-histidine N(alpha)-methyltransferase [Candidatus Micrarchaeota archaeon]|nr:L-histidine N(alpha)-methyltransferase [Candidatus Micrarchaeota archaeon]
MFGDLILNQLENQTPEGGRWRLDDSKLWYLSEDQAKAYLKATEGEKYHTSFFSKEEVLLEKHKEEIVKSLPDDVAIIDLGCGTAEKSLIKVEEAIKQGKNARFHLVDVNPYFLTLAIRNSKEIGCIPVAHLDLIENFPIIFGKIREKNDAIYIHFGPNHVNFEAGFLKKIKKSMTKKDAIYISAHQMRNEKNVDEIIAGYATKEVEEMNFKVLEMVGFDKKHLQYGVRLNNDTIECYFTVKSVPEYLEYLGIKPGHEIIVVTSRKPTLEEFEQLLSIFDYKMWLNDERDFAIAVCKLKESKK